MVPVVCTQQLAFLKAAGLVGMQANSTNTMVRVLRAVHRAGVVLQHALRALAALTAPRRCWSRS